MVSLKVLTRPYTPPPEFPTTLPAYQTFTPSGDSRLIYVAANGSDANDGLSDTTPKLTISAGKALMRDGFPDWLLLRRGDTWTDQQFGSFTLSGRSNTERMGIGAYGSLSLARPRVLFASGQSCLTIYSTTVAYSNWFIESVEMVPNARTDAGTDAILFGSDGGANLTIQDCYIHGARVGMQIIGTTDKLTNVTILRNTIADCWSTSGGAAFGGLFTGIDGLDIIGNNVDRCGWLDSGFTLASGTTRNLYVQSDCDNVTFDDDYSLRSSSNGVQLRAGGNCRRNIVSACSQGIRYGSTASGASYPYPGSGGPWVGVAGEVNDNLIDFMRDLQTDPVTADAGGLELAFCAGVTAARNICQDITSGAGDGYGLRLDGQQSAPTGDPTPEPITDLAVSEHISYSCDRPLHIWGAMGSQITGVTVTGVFHTTQTDTSGRVVHSVSTLDVADIAFSNCRYESARTGSQWFRDGSTDRSLASWQSAIEASALGTIPSYSDPGRTPAQYLDFVLSTSGSTREDFYAALRLQRRGAWETRLETTHLINYVRAGYDLAELP
jgi:hypothetical protein